MENEIRLYNKSLNAKEKVNMILLGGLVIKTVCFFCKGKVRIIVELAHKISERARESRAVMRSMVLVIVKKENDRKIGLRYNGDMDSFDESR